MKMTQHMIYAGVVVLAVGVLVTERLPVGTIKRALASTKRDQVRVDDPKVRFISLSNSQ